MMFAVRIFIETSYRGLRQQGGWYWSIVEYQTSKGPATVEFKRYIKDVNGNRLELLALEAALGALKKPCEIELYSDSQYLNRAFSQQWLKKWKETEWKTFSGEPVKNEDLWKKIDEKMASHFANMRFCENHEYKNAMKFELEKLKQ